MSVYLRVEVPVLSLQSECLEQRAVSPDNQDRLLTATVGTKLFPFNY